MTVQEHLNQNYRELVKLQQLLDTQTNDLESTRLQIAKKQEWVNTVETMSSLKGSDTSMIDLMPDCLTYPDFTQTCL